MTGKTKKPYWNPFFRERHDLPDSNVLKHVKRIDTFGGDEVDSGLATTASPHTSPPNSHRVNDSRAAVTSNVSDSGAESALDRSPLKQRIMTALNVVKIKPKLSWGKRLFRLLFGWRVSKQRKKAIVVLEAALNSNKKLTLVTAVNNLASLPVQQFQHYGDTKSWHLQQQCQEVMTQQSNATLAEFFIGPPTAVTPSSFSLSETTSVTSDETLVEEQSVHTNKESEQSLRHKYAQLLAEKNRLLQLVECIPAISHPTENNPPISRRVMQLADQYELSATAAETRANTLALELDAVNKRLSHRMAVENNTLREGLARKSERVRIAAALGVDLTPRTKISEETLEIEDAFYGQAPRLIVTESRV